MFCHFSSGLIAVRANDDHHMMTTSLLFLSAYFFITLFPVFVAKYNHNCTNDFETDNSRVREKKQQLTNEMIARLANAYSFSSLIYTRRISYLLSNLPHKILPYLFALDLYCLISFISFLAHCRSSSLVASLNSVYLAVCEYSIDTECAPITKES